MDLAKGEVTGGLTVVFSSRGELLGDGVGLTDGVAEVWSGTDCGEITTSVEGAFVFWGA